MKPKTKEKNVLQVKVCNDSVTTKLPNNVLLVTVALYHPKYYTKTQEWQVPSFMTLYDLHSCFHCLSNYVTFDTNNTKVSFQIEDTCYDNLSVTLEDLKVRIGVPYAYKHRECCHHMLVVTEIKLIEPTDPLDASAYPFQVFSSPKKRRTCEVCNHLHAKFICLYDEILQKDVCYICEMCYEELHFDLGGTQVFKHYEVYPYIHD